MVFEDILLEIHLKKKKVLLAEENALYNAVCIQFYEMCMLLTVILVEFINTIVLQFQENS